MKRVKRIMYVILLLLLLLIVGYMACTCSRLKSNIPIEELEYTSYCSKDESATLIISKNYAGEYTYDGVRYDLKFVEYKDSIMNFRSGNKAYFFTVLDDGDLFDTDTKKLLIRSNAYEKKNYSV